MPVQKANTRWPPQRLPQIVPCIPRYALVLMGVENEDATRVCPARIIGGVDGPENLADPNAGAHHNLAILPPSVMVPQSMGAFLWCFPTNILWRNKLQLYPTKEQAVGLFLQHQMRVLLGVVRADNTPYNPRLDNHGRRQ